MDWFLTNPIGQTVTGGLILAATVAIGRAAWGLFGGVFRTWRGRVRSSRFTFTGEEASRFFKGYGESEAIRLVNLNDPSLPVVEIELPGHPGDLWQVPIPPDTLGWELALAAHARFGGNNFFRLYHRPSEKDLRPDLPVADTVAHGDRIVALANGGGIWGVSPPPGLLGRVKRLWWRSRRPSREAIKRLPSS